MTIKPLAAIVVLLWGLSAVFAIAFGVAEWRMPDDNADLITDLDAQIESLKGQVLDIESQVQDLESDDSALDSRLATIESPPPVRDIDIEQLYSQANYTDCRFVAFVVVDNAEQSANRTYAAYIAENATFEEYEADYESFSQAYDAYLNELDACLNTYLEESPFE